MQHEISILGKESEYLSLEEKRRKVANYVKALKSKK